MQKQISKKESEPRSDVVNRSPPASMSHAASSVPRSSGRSGRPTVPSARQANVARDTDHGASVDVADTRPQRVDPSAHYDALPGLAGSDLSFVNIPASVDEYNQHLFMEYPEQHITNEQWGHPQTLVIGTEDQVMAAAAAAAAVATGADPDDVYAARCRALLLRGIDPRQIIPRSFTFDRFS